MEKTLFDECVEQLKQNVLILNPEDSNKISQLFENTYPLTEWGKIDWDRINKKSFIGHDRTRILPALEKLLGRNEFDKSVYIEWSEAGIPVIKTDLDLVVKFFDDITCVAFEKFIFNPPLRYIIEVRHLGDINVGVLNEK